MAEVGGDRRKLILLQVLVETTSGLLPDIDPALFRASPQPPSGMLRLDGTAGVPVHFALRNSSKVLMEWRAVQLPSQVSLVKYPRHLFPARHNWKPYLCAQDHQTISLQQSILITGVAAFLVPIWQRCLPNGGPFHRVTTGKSRTLPPSSSTFSTGRSFGKLEQIPVQRHIAPGGRRQPQLV